jgi:aryl-alcohol dehydrogenase-like predicted oxidoreductase
MVHIVSRAEYVGEPHRRRYSNTNPEPHQFGKVLRAGWGKILYASDARAIAIAREVEAVARECGRSPAQIALAWLRHRPVPVIPIIGARRLEQVKDNRGNIEVKLDQPHLDRLEEVSRVELGFPHDFYKKEMVRTIAFGGMRDLIDT